MSAAMALEFASRCCLPSMPLQVSMRSVTPAPLIAACSPMKRAYWRVTLLDAWLGAPSWTVKAWHVSHCEFSTADIGLCIVLLSLSMLCCRDACILVLSNGFAVGCLITIILHLIIPEEHDYDNPDDEIRSPEGHASFTTHGPRKAGHTPAAYYNDQQSNDDSTTMKPVELAHMDKDDDTAHAANRV